MFSLASSRRESPRDLKRDTGWMQKGWVEDGNVAHKFEDGNAAFKK